MLHWFHSNISVKIKLICLLMGMFVSIHAQTHNDSIKEKIQKLQRDRKIVDANRLLNQNTSLEMEYSFRILHENLKMAEESEDYEALAYTRLSIGNFWFFRGDKIKAYENYRLSESISRRYGFDKITGLSLMNASNVSNQMEKRIQQLKMAIPYFKNSGDQLNLAKAYLNIGNCYSAFTLGTEILWVNNRRDSILNHVGSNKDLKYFRDSAFLYYKLAKELNNSLHHHELSASYHLRMAQWFSYDSLFTEAEKNFLISSHHFNQARMYKGTVYCLLELINCKLKQNDLNQVHQLADSAMQLSIKHGFTDYYSDACLIKSSLYEKTKNYNESLHFFKIYYNSVQQNNTNLIEEKINALNLELTIKDHENTINNLIQQSKINRLIILVIIVFTVFVILAAFLYMKNRKRKIKYMAESMKKAEELNRMQIALLNTQLENNNLKSKLMEEKVNSRSEILIMVANKIQKLKNYYDTLHENITTLVQTLPPERRHVEIKPVKLSLIQIEQEQNDLLELNSLSKQINQEFFFIINKNYPQLTNEDKNLLSMLITDLNTKQIAEFLNISYESVFKKRYRLRKKLNISNKISFTDFYKDIIKKLGENNEN